MSEDKLEDIEDLGDVTEMFKYLSESSTEMGRIKEEEGSMLE